MFIEFALYSVTLALMDVNVQSMDGNKIVMLQTMLHRYPHECACAILIEFHIGIHTYMAWLLVSWKNGCANIINVDV